MRDGRIAVLGEGRLGSLFVALSVLTGLRRFLGLDPQVVQPANRPAWLLARPEDDGCPKAEVLAAFARRTWPDVELVPLVGRIEDGAQAVLARPDVVLVVVASNTAASRAHAARAAVDARVPMITLGIQDGRAAWHGLVTRWVPGIAGRACPACFLPDETATLTGDAPLPGPALALTASVGVRVALDTLQDAAIVPPLAVNYWTLDAGTLSLEAGVASPRADCTVCQTTEEAS